MNAVVETRNPVMAPHATHKFKLLLRREFWEHRGGFFWAPLVTGAIVCVLTLLGLITTSVMFQNAKRDGNIDIEGVRMGVNGHEQVFGFAGDVTLLVGVGLACAVLVFVVFFYALGSVYDERRDRSILFWKSLPISDTQVVLSKALWALVLAPALAIGIGLVIGLCLWLMGALASVINGVPGSAAIFTESHLLRVLLHVVSTIPVYTFWALPSVGWLMLCSAWARSKPFLWAVLVPILVCTLISWMGTLPGVEIPHDNVWYTIAFRGLLSIIPGTWYFNPSVNAAVPTNINGPEDLARAIDLSSSWQAFGTLDLWLGAAIGAAMIFAAIRLRRWRDEG